MMSKIVMALSGGLDSAVMLGKFCAEGHDVTVFHFQYGSKHNPYEKDAAQALANFYGKQLFQCDLSAVVGNFKSNLLAGQGDVPEGHYEAESMRQTVVPGRNLLFIACLAGYAESIGADLVALGVHAGDHYIYPDCRPEFISSAAGTVYLSSDGKISIATPFKAIDKTAIVRVGMRYMTPFSLTRTCYKPQSRACGKCGSCQERLTAFAAVGMDDPIPYESRELIPK